MSDTLLPHNATQEERALEAVFREALTLPAPLREIWNPETCPLALLPWLAGAFSVDEWNPEWPEASKRAVIAESFQVHRQKGTVGAVRRSLEAMGFSPKMVEWFQIEPQGTPHTFSLILEVLESANDLARISQALRVVETTKPARSHLTSVQISAATVAQPVAAAAVMVGQVITVSAP